MSEVETTTAPAVPETAAPAAPETTSAAPVAPDPFPVDEAVLASLSPESRTAVEPLLNEWKKKATESIQKETAFKGEWERKVKAFDQLVGNQNFQQWYRDQTNPPAQKVDAVKPEGPNYPAPEEWVSAANDPKAWTELMKRHTEAVLQEKFGDTIKENAEKTKNLEMSIEFDQLTRAHPEVWDYDKLGIMEPFIGYYRDIEGLNMEAAFKKADAAYKAVMEKANARVNGTIAEKKDGTVEKSAAAGGGENIIYANSPEEARRESIRAAMEGRKVTVLVKRK